ncbi:Uncharacterised protein [Klebsiella variicola]|uniref:Inner membrane protein n=1 Tax=Klebsiella variicola TaxID=244366 RepID=A0ABD7P1Y0_KLEVA|nr:Uncharacterised protein [Klebsiella variicola]
MYANEFDEDHAIVLLIVFTIYLLGTFFDKVITIFPYKSLMHCALTFVPPVLYHSVFYRKSTWRSFPIQGSPVTFRNSFSTRLY